MKNRKLMAVPFILAVMMIMLSAGCSMGAGDIVVGRVGSENVTVKDVALYANYMLLNSGSNPSDMNADDIAGLNGTALEYAVTHKIVLQKAAKLGLYPLSAERQKEADDSSAQFLASLSSSGKSLSTYGMTQKDLKTLMTFFKVSELLSAETTKDVTVTDDEIQAEYDKLLASQKSSYTSDPTAYDTALSGGSTTIVYRPEGYRYVKHILIAMPDDIASQISSAADAASVASLRKQGLEQIEAKANEVLAKVQGGGDFDALMAEYGKDPGMQSEPYKTTGYQVGAKTSFMPEFLEAAMGLAKAGDTTGLVATDYGYHIIKYVGPVPAGAIPLGEVKESIRATVLSGKQNTAFNALVEQWKKETTIKKNASKIPS